MKYPRTYHFPFSQGATNDDKIQRDLSTLVSHDIVMLEKLDGQNTMINQGGFYARSHTSIDIHPWSANVRPIWDRVKASLGTLELFGENLYAIHSIEYTNLKDFFYVFAIRDGDMWLSWDNVKIYAEALDLKVVPEITRGVYTEQQIKKLIDTNMPLGSSFEGTCEGYVFRLTKEFSNDEFSKSVIKYVRKNHVQTDTHWTKNWKKAKINYE